MKVLQVIGSISPSRGGPSRAVADIERALAARGVHVTTVTTNDDGDARRLAVQCGTPVETAYATRWYFALSSSTYLISLDLRRWVKQYVADFDVVHAHALFSFAPVATVLIARRRRVPYILRPLGVLSPYGISSRRFLMKKLSLMLLERQLINSAGAVHFTSLAEQSEAQSLGLKGNGVVIPLGIDTEARPDGDKIHRWDAPRILFLSRIDPKKNLEGLLRALPMVLRRHPGAKVSIAGEGAPAYVSGLKSLARELGIDASIDWLGYVESERKTAAFATATAFVLPSYSENFGIAVVEALAAGLPCVVSRGVAISREIQGANAGVVTGTDAASIAAGIVETLNSRSGYEAMSAAARSLAVDTFSIATMGARLEALYRTVAASAAERAGPVVA
jgi:glycosyltransferase involved in cell wall biosynthesis